MSGHLNIRAAPPTSSTEGIFSRRLSRSSMASRRCCDLLKRARPDLPHVRATAPHPAYRARCSIRSAPALPLTLIHVDSIEQQASPARCRGRSHGAKPSSTIMDDVRTRAAASRPSQRASARLEPHPWPLGRSPYRCSCAPLSGCTGAFFASGRPPSPPIMWAAATTTSSGDSRGARPPRKLERGAR